jgi:hypothetical protein
MTAMNKCFQPFATLGLVALAALAGCSDAERISDGDRFSSEATGQPGVVLIDDMEDGSQYLLSDDGRTGLWYIYNDASLNAVQEPSLGFPMYRVLGDDGAPELGSAVLPRPCGASSGTPFFASETPDECRFVARTWGTGQRGWGAGVGLDLNGENNQKNPFDASEFAGIGFFVTGTAANDLLRVKVQDARTTPESAVAADRAGVERCRDTADSRCNDHFGVNITLTPNVWKWVSIPFGCMAPEGWGYPGSGDLLTQYLVGLQFQIQGGDPTDSGMPAATADVKPFDFAIDNLSFLEAGSVDPTACPTR